jgi:hypothetical protein
MFRPDPPFPFFFPQDASGTAANMAKVLQTDFSAQDAAIDGAKDLQGAYEPSAVETYTFSHGWNMPKNVPPAQQNWGWFLRWHGWNVSSTDLDTV